MRGGTLRESVGGRGHDDTWYVDGVVVVVCESTVREWRARCVRCVSRVLWGCVVELGYRREREVPPPPHSTTVRGRAQE